MTDRDLTVNVRIEKSTHEKLKHLCKQERMLIGGLVDKVLNQYIMDWNLQNESTETTESKN